MSARCGVPHGHIIALSHNSLNCGLYIRKRCPNGLHEVSKAIWPTLFVPHHLMSAVHEFGREDFDRDIEPSSVKHFFNDFVNQPFIVLEFRRGWHHVPSQSFEVSSRLLILYGAWKVFASMDKKDTACRAKPPRYRVSRSSAALSSTQ